MTETALSGTWSFISRCLLDAAVIWSIGVELVFNSVAGFSGGVSCPSEVRVFTVL